jgi:hypothetical protein
MNTKLWIAATVGFVVSLTSAQEAAGPLPTPQTLYRQLLAIFPEDRQGFSKDADKNADGLELITDHQPMT